MAENSGRYLYTLSITLITLLVIFLGFIGEIFKHQTRQIRYTRNQLFKIGKTLYKTKVNDMHANTIKSLGIRQTFMAPRRDKKRKRGGKKHIRPWDTNQGVHRNLFIPLERHHKTQWNPSISNLMLTNIQSLKTEDRCNTTLHIRAQTGHMFHYWDLDFKQWRPAIHKGKPKDARLLYTIMWEGK